MARKKFKKIHNRKVIEIDDDTPSFEGVDVVSPVVRKKRNDAEDRSYDRPSINRVERPLPVLEPVPEKEEIQPVELPKEPEKSEIPVSMTKIKPAVFEEPVTETKTIELPEEPEEPEFPEEPLEPEISEEPEITETPFEPVIPENLTIPEVQEETEIQEEPVKEQHTIGEIEAETPEAPSHAFPEEKSFELGDEEEQQQQTEFVDVEIPIVKSFFWNMETEAEAVEKMEQEVGFIPDDDAVKAVKMADKASDIGFELNIENIENPDNLVLDITKSNLVDIPDEKPEFVAPIVSIQKIEEEQEEEIEERIVKPTIVIEPAPEPEPEPIPEPEPEPISEPEPEPISEPEPEPIPEPEPEPIPEPEPEPIPDPEMPPFYNPSPKAVPSIEEKIEKETESVPQKEISLDDQTEEDFNISGYHGLGEQKKTAYMPTAPVDIEVVDTMGEEMEFLTKNTDVVSIDSENKPSYFHDYSDEPDDYVMGPPKKSVKRRVLNWTITIIIAIVVALCVNVYLFRPSRVSGNSMQPTLQDNQIVYLSRMPYILSKIRTGDIVVIDSRVDQPRSEFDLFKEVIKYNVITKLFGVQQPEYFYVKRVIATEGQTLEFKDGRVYRDGILLVEDYINEQTVSTYPEGTRIEVEPGHIYVMGDNRNHSTDSRSIGQVPVSHIIGKRIR